MILGGILGVVVILTHLNEHVREYKFWPIAEIMNLIVCIVLPTGIFAAIATIRNVSARRHNQRIAQK